MRMSQLFGKTLRQDPAEAETPSHRLLLRAGLVHQVAAGVYAFLPSPGAPSTTSNASSAKRWTPLAARS